MDKIHKIISLEQAKNRTPNALEYYAVDKETNTCILYDDKNTWGGYCVDIAIPKVTTTYEPDPEPTPPPTPVDPDDPTPPPTPPTPIEECSKECSPLITWATEVNDTFEFEEIKAPTQEPGKNIIAYAARYKNLMLKYHWILNKFIPSIRYYMKCSSEFKSVVVKNNDIFNSSIKLYGSLEDVSQISTGTIVGVTELYNEFIRIFKSFENAANFMTFMDKLLSEGLFAPLSGVTPYLDLNFSITSSQTDLGVMSPFAVEWESKKKYYLGEVVFYHGDSYMLTRCNVGDYDKFELTGALLDDVLNCVNSPSTCTKYVLKENIFDIPSTAYVLNPSYSVINKTGEYGAADYTQYVLKETQSDGTLLYYFIYPYYKGEFNDLTRISSFDSLDVNHWKLLRSETYDKITTGSERGTIPDDAEYECIGESQLISLKRQITSYDDYGNGLNFIINTQKDTSGVVISRTAEMCYMLGTTNEVSESTTTCHADELVTIRYRENEASQWSSIIHTGGIKEDDFAYDNGLIEFTYYIGAEYNITSIPVTGTNSKIFLKTRKPYTGVKYNEVWNFTKNTTTVRIDGEDLTFTYVTISPVDSINNNTGNLDIVGKNPIYSLVTYYGKGIKENEVLFVPYYKDEDLLGVQDINTLEYDLQEGKYVSTINAHIERGISASFEKHNILGEVKSFADLENYRNNFFKL